MRPLRPLNERVEERDFTEEMVFNDDDDDGAAAGMIGWGLL
ncbi:MAG: hypothetical protein ABI883_00700 [Chthoniobacterales bacterium]